MSFSVLDFRPAQYFSGKDCYVGYYVKNPFTHRLVRKKIKLNHISSSRTRKRYGHRLAFEMTENYVHRSNAKRIMEATRLEF